MTIRHRWAFGGAAALLVTVAAALLGTSRNRGSVQAHGTSSNDRSGAVVFASPGRVEGASEATQVGAAADGVLKGVYVKEGQFVKRGTLLGEIACEDPSPHCKQPQRKRTRRVRHERVCCEAPATRRKK
jgi:multidrug efflux pump subunit AcrA (membrane-fusion protein)